MDDPTTRTTSAPGTSLPLTLTRIWWAPIAFIAVALLLLLVTPIIVNQRIALLRRDVVDIADNARVQVNDLQAAYVARLYAHAGQPVAPRRLADSAEAANIGKETRDEQALDSLVRHLGPVATARLDRLLAESRAWHARLDAQPPRRVSAAADSALAESGLALLAAAEALDDELLRISIDARDRVRYYAEMNVIATSALTPFALVALGMVFWVGGRLLSLARAIDRERTELHRAIKARVALIHGVTHDVKNPLGAAMGYVELMQEGLAGPVRPEQAEMLTRVRRLMDVALLTVGELLEVARREAGDERTSLAPVDLEAVVAELREDYAASALEKEIELVHARSAEAVIATTDATRVRRILANLLSNAVKYTPRGGRVLLATRVDGRRRVVSVHDDGPGVDPAFRERIFGEFVRGPEADRQASGHGLGLATSRRMARSLGGDVRLVDSPLGGAGFELDLPA